MLNINLTPGIFQQPTLSMPPSHNQADKQYIKDQSQQPISFLSLDYQQQNHPVSFQSPDYPSQPTDGYNPGSQMNPLGYSQHNQGIWRRGSLLIVHRNATFPATCVKCGIHYASSSNVSYVKFYCTKTLELRQTVRLYIPLCQKHIGNRNLVLKFMTGGSVLAAIIIVFTYSPSGYAADILLYYIFATLAALIALGLSYEYLYKPLQVSRIQSDYIYLKGVNEDYLNQFPSC